MILSKRDKKFSKRDERIFLREVTGYMVTLALKAELRIRSPCTRDQTTKIPFSSREREGGGEKKSLCQKTPPRTAAKRKGCKFDTYNGDLLIRW